MNTFSQYASEMQLLSSLISECSFENNLISLGQDTVIENELKVAVSNIIKDTNSNLKNGSVRITLKGNIHIEKNPTAQCKYRLVVEGQFSFPMDKSDDDFNQLLWVNGSSILYGIARAKMEVMTSMVFDNGKITLPVINMLDFIQDQHSKNHAEK